MPLSTIQKSDYIKFIKNTLIPILEKEGYSDTDKMFIGAILYKKYKGNQSSILNRIKNLEQIIAGIDDLTKDIK